MLGFKHRPRGPEVRRVVFLGRPAVQCVVLRFHFVPENTLRTSAKFFPDVGSSFHKPIV